MNNPTSANELLIALMKVKHGKERKMETLDIGIPMLFKIR